MQGALDNGITLIHGTGSFSMRIMVKYAWKGCFGLDLDKPKRRVKSSQVINSHNAFCICAKSKQQKPKNISMRNILVSVAPLAVASWANCCKCFLTEETQLFRSPLSLRTYAHGAVAILKRVTFARSRWPRASLFFEPCGPAVCSPEFAHEN